MVIYENIVMTSELSTYFFYMFAPSHGLPRTFLIYPVRSLERAPFFGITLTVAWRGTARLYQKGKHKYHPGGVEGSKINRPYWIVRSAVGDDCAALVAAAPRRQLS